MTGLRWLRSFWADPTKRRLLAVLMLTELFRSWVVSVEGKVQELEEERSLRQGLRSLEDVATLKDLEKVMAGAKSYVEQRLGEERGT